LPLNSVAKIINVLELATVAGISFYFTPLNPPRRTFQIMIILKPHLGGLGVNLS
jgi:hypothetical protein